MHRIKLHFNDSGHPHCFHCQTQHTYSLILWYYIVHATSTKYIADNRILTLPQSLPQSWQKVTVTKCVAANLVISILYVINVAFVYTKSQKLLTAFRSAVHLSRKEIRRTSAAQVFTIVIFLLISNAISIITFTQESANVVNFLDEDQMLRVHHCNTGYHENVLISFITLLQMLCLVQAYRGRHLPGPMNNAMSLVYAILIATINFLISFPITAFLDEVDKEFARLIVVITNCIFIVLLLYGQKCYLIMFRPRKNTRHYFTQKRLEAMSSTTLPSSKRMKWTRHTFFFYKHNIYKHT